MLQIFIILLLLVAAVLTFIRLRKLVVAIARSLFIGFNNEEEREAGYYFFVLAVLVLVIAEKIVAIAFK